MKYYKKYVTWSYTYSFSISAEGGRANAELWGENYFLPGKSFKWQMMSSARNQQVICLSE